MKKIILLSAIIFSAVLSAQTWSPLSVGVTAAVMDLSFPSEDTGFASLGNGAMRKTFDGGITWSNVPVPTSAGHIDFVSASKGFAVNSTGLLRTTNGGATWTTAFTNSNAYWFDVFFCDPMTGYASGMKLTYDSFYVYKTIDGGMNWFACTAIQDVNIDYPRVFFRTPTEGYLAGSDNLHRTNDGGLTWVTVYTAPGPDLIGTVTAPDATHAYCATQYYMDVARSTDGGNTWASASQPIGSISYASHFLTGTTGFICGGDGVTSGFIAQTTNGWNSFTLAYSGSQTMLSMDFPSSSVGYCGGTGGLILKYTDPLSVSAMQQPQFNCYPNPATDQLSITNVEVGADIIIRNALGQIVMQQRAENTTMSIDVRALAEGVYTIETAGNTRVIGKFIRQ